MEFVTTLDFKSANVFKMSVILISEVCFEVGSFNASGISIFASSKANYWFIPSYFVKSFSLS